MLKDGASQWGSHQLSVIRKPTSAVLLGGVVDVSLSLEQAGKRSYWRRIIAAWRTYNWTSLILEELPQSTRSGNMPACGEEGMKFRKNGIV